MIQVLLITLAKSTPLGKKAHEQSSFCMVENPPKTLKTKLQENPSPSKTHFLLSLTLGFKRILSGHQRNIISFFFIIQIPSK
ncbi:hypothetical protein LguiB_034356 [Lonicera macranthoides]